MTREIKFRGKSVEKGNLVYGWGCFTDESNKKWIILSENNWIQVEEIQSFTGLKDKNGKEIYEGDIISNGTFIGKIIWDSGRFDWVKPSGSEYSLGDLKTTDLEIIGNIYSTPELIK